MRRYFPFLVLPLFLSACGDDPASPVRDCGVGLQVTVTGGPSPVVRWTPDCRATYVGILQARPGEDGGPIVWSVALPPEHAGFRSGVVFGEVPDGAVVFTPYAGLTAGTSYNVLVGQAEGDPRGSSGQFAISGEQYFTPSQ